MTIGFFSPLYEGESFYSGIARYSIHTGYSPAQMASIFFDGQTQPVNRWLPFDLLKFHEKIKGISTTTPELLIKSHTLFPLYSEFLSKDKADKLYTFMLKERGYVTHQVKIDASISEFHYCHLCVENDFNNNGESFWRILHSFPFLQICPNHNIVLSLWKVPPVKYNPRDYYSCEPSLFVKDKILSSPSEMLTLAAKDFESIQTKVLKPDFENLKEKAKQKGFLHQKGNSYTIGSTQRQKYILCLKKAKVDFGAIVEKRPIIINRLFSGSPHPYNAHNFIFLSLFLDTLPNQSIKHSEVVTSSNIFCEELVEGQNFLLRKMIHGKNKKINIDKTKFVTLRNQRRKIWQAELKSKDFYSIKVSGIKKKTEYRWLLKKDHKWVSSINKKYRRKSNGREATSVITQIEAANFIQRINEMRCEVFLNRVPRRFTMALIASHLDKRGRTILSANALVHNHALSLIEDDFNFKLRRIDYFFFENPNIKISKSDLFSKFKISHSISGAEKRMLNEHLIMQI